MSAADRMVIRTRDGAYRSVQRRTGLGMISRGHAEFATGGRATGSHPEPGYDPEPTALYDDGHQTVTVDEVRERLALAMGLSVQDITPTAVDDPHGNSAREAASMIQALDAARELPPEPRGNASRPVWAQYAQSLGVEVTSSMTRDEIRDAAQDAAQSLANLPQPALTGGRLETPEDEPVTEESVTDDEDPGTE